MTTWAFDGKVLAADRLAGSHYSVGKIFKLPDGSYLTGSGTYDELFEVATWIIQFGMDPDKRPTIDETSVVIVDKKGKASWLTVPWLRPVAILEPFCAGGSGSDFALGAMEAGLGAKRAVEIAMKFDKMSGNGVDSLRVVPPKKGEKRDEQ
jgi:20S proteasome alpha/beta subunit